MTWRHTSFRNFRKSERGHRGIACFLSGGFCYASFYKKSYKEIAEDSGVSMKTIAYRIQQATKLLRKDLADLLTTIIVCIMSIVR